MPDGVVSADSGAGVGVGAAGSAVLSADGSDAPDAGALLSGSPAGALSCPEAVPACVSGALVCAPDSGPAVTKHDR